jgi:hypothetical protein
MAGGVWFLGQAVAQADTGQTNDTAQENTQTADSEGGSGVTGNLGGNFNSSSNSAHVTVTTNVAGGNGGTNTSNVNTGVQGAIIVVKSEGESRPPVLQGASVSSEGPRSEHHSNDANGSLNISTHSVYVEQNANGGSVSGSGNISELPSVNQSNNVWQSNNQSASSEDNHNKWPRHDDKEMYKSNGMSRGHGGLTGNIGGNFNHSSNRLWMDVSTNVYGGDGGYNDSNVNTGVQLALLACIAEHGDAWCKANIETGSVTVIQNANGGDVSDSGNIGARPAKHDHAKENAHMAKKEAVSPAAAPAAKHSAALSSAQPSSGQLAFTGADISLALTLGLLALGLGGAFTLAGRRRETGTV